MTMIMAMIMQYDGNDIGNEMAMIDDNDNELQRSLLDYCEKHKAGDTLVSGTTDAQNPFREKKGCTVI
ncbi:hypothetical protein ANCCAN_04094 [Ancylostoma caninum]|uniref:G protein gamma domain-containing protein n=1 Tax=Ancylostoma caninum TaxID=29170 RepID=A0A368H2K8_ANCCA|nr:hypothetical protein ANCCAN_04094 [Ancylostoma caninum]